VQFRSDPHFAVSGDDPSDCQIALGNIFVDQRRIVDFLVMPAISGKSCRVEMGITEPLYWLTGEKRGEQVKTEECGGLFRAFCKLKQDEIDHFRRLLLEK